MSLAKAVSPILQKLPLPRRFATMTTKFDFSGKKVVVTGGSQGIGREISIGLAKANASVIAVDVCDPAKVEPFDKGFLLKRSSPFFSTAHNVCKPPIWFKSIFVSPIAHLCCSFHNLDVHMVQCDITQDASTIATSLAKHLPVDALVNNAGVALNDAFLDVKLADLQKTLQVNLQGAIVVSQVILRSMLEHNVTGGAIVNISSQAASLPLHNHTAYCASKAALDSVTRTLALEFGPKGIRVNSVNPTVVMTEMGRKAWSDPEKSSRMLARIPLGKFADREDGSKFAECSDVVNAVMFLLSDAAAMITGMSFPVDGGATTT